MMNHKKPAGPRPVTASAVGAVSDEASGAICEAAPGDHPKDDLHKYGAGGRRPGDRRRLAVCLGPSGPVQVVIVRLARPTDYLESTASTPSHHALMY